MVYSVAWDEADPDGTEDAATLDTELQNLKISIRERLEDLIPDWADDGVDPKTILITGVLTPRAEVSRSANQSINDNSETAIIWDSEDLDDGDMVDIGAQPTRVTIPTGEGGFYIYATNIQWQQNATGVRHIELKVSGTKVAAALFPTVGANTFPDMALTWMGELVAGNYLETWVYQNSTGALLTVAAQASIVRLA